MRIAYIPMLGLALLSLAGPVSAAETPAKSRIVTVGLFKNGLAVVKREVSVGGPGTYVLEDVPQPVHGTYWVESAVPVETVVRMQDVRVAEDAAGPGSLQDDFAGQKVTIFFKGGRLPPVSGTMLKIKPPQAEEPTGGTPHFLILQTAKGRSYLEPSEIAYVEAEGSDSKVTRRLPRLVLTVGGTAKGPTRVTVSYLTHGLSWAPSYRIDLADAHTLLLEQQAVIKNELANLDAVEIKLISGFPSVQFANVVSPLAARTTWATFFQQLGQRGSSESDLTRNSITSQLALNNPAAPYASGLGATPAGEGVDLHYESIGSRTLAEGAALALSVARGKAAYERIVEWLVADTRDEYGREVGARGQGEDRDDTAWDALKFKNPFAFAMTTGPAMVVSGDQFNGQRMSYWVNAGEETVLRVTKALSVRTRAIEHEEQKVAGDGRDLVWIGGRQFRRSKVVGELAVSNHRQETVHLVIRRRFSGDLLEADGEPKKSLREEGVYSVNRRNELSWTLSLRAGEEKKLTYRYTVLVAN